MDWVYTSTEIFGVLIEEPMTSLTDLVSGVVGLVAFYRLQKLRLQDQAHIFFKYYFLFIGSATFCAGIFGHATQYLVGYNAKTIGWTLSAMALFCLENAALSYFQKVSDKKTLAWLRPLIALQFLIYLGLVINPSTRIFELVQINSVIGMVVVSLTLFIARHWKQKTPGSSQVLLGMFASFLPGIVYSSQFTLHIYFNYHDISHLLMAGCVYLLYRGAKQLGLENEN